MAKTAQFAASRLRLFPAAVVVGPAVVVAAAVVVAPAVVEAGRLKKIRKASSNRLK